MEQERVQPSICYAAFQNLVVVKHTYSAILSGKIWAKSVKIWEFARRLIPSSLPLVLLKCLTPIPKYSTISCLKT